MENSHNERGGKPKKNIATMAATPLRSTCQPMATYLMSDCLRIRFHKACMKAESARAGWRGLAWDYLRKSISFWLTSSLASCCTQCVALSKKVKFPTSHRSIEGCAMSELSATSRLPHSIIVGYGTRARADV